MKTTILLSKSPHHSGRFLCRRGVSPWMKQGWDELIHTCIHTSILIHTCACMYIPLSLADRDKHWNYKMPTYCDDHIRTYAHSECPLHPWCWLSWPRLNSIWYQLNLVFGSKQPPYLCQSFFGSHILWVHFLIFCTLTRLVLTGKAAEQSMFSNWKAVLKQSWVKGLKSAD